MKEMQFREHLQELRTRLIRALAGLLICFFAVYPFGNQIFERLSRPLLAILEAHGAHQLVFTRLTEPFLVELKISFFAAVLLSSPWIFFQFWSFVGPGLKVRERAAVLTAVLATLGFFLLGMAFAYWVIFPVAFQFFIGYAGEVIQPMLSMSDYLDFCVRTLLGFGLIFEMPVILGVFGLAGIITAGQVAGFWRHATVIAAIVSAILTPPDVASMVMMMIPMMALYGISIVTVWMLSRLATTRQEEQLHAAKLASPHRNSA